MNLPPQYSERLWRGKVAARDITVTASRSSGAGGQNVNKTSTKVEIRFSIENAVCLSPREKEILRRWLNHKRPSLYSEVQDSIVITDSTTRSQHTNRERALEKLNELITRALTPVRRRIETKTPFSQKRKRLDSKKRDSKIKAGRKKHSGNYD